MVASSDLSTMLSAPGDCSEVQDLALWVAQPKDRLRYRQLSLPSNAVPRSIDHCCSLKLHIGRIGGFQ